MIFDYKMALAAAAILLTIVGYVPYLRGILKGTNRPHIFTWVIWVIVAGIAFMAQLSAQAGPGAWVTGFICLMCIMVSILAFRQGSKNITRSDIIMFVGALAAIPAWMLTRDPLWSVVIVSIINSVAFYPTFRKTWNKPHEEHMTIYAWNIPRQGLAIAALSQYSLTTILFPASVIFMCVLFFSTITYRRHVLKRPN